VVNWFLVCINLLMNEWWCVECVQKERGRLLEGRELVKIDGVVGLTGRQVSALFI